MGRPRKPTALKVIEGNPSKRKLNKAEPLPTGLPTAPKSLSRDAAPIWRRLLASMPPKVWTSADEHLLTAYCEDVVLSHRCTAEIEANGLTVAGSTGQVVASPFVAMRASAHSRLVSIGARLGLDPASRQNLNSGEEEDENPFGIV